jgi:hypothetical protein
VRALGSPMLVVYCAGRGAGKDILAVREALEDALILYGERKPMQVAGTLDAELNPLVKVWVLASQEQQLSQAWDDWKGALAALAREWGVMAGFEGNDTSWLFREVVREQKIFLFGRGEIEIEHRVTSTKDALRGPGVDVVHWTEFAMEKGEGELSRAYDMELSGTITRAGRFGRVYATTTPKGLKGGFWELMKRVFKGDGFKEVERGSLVSEDGLTYYRHAEDEDNVFLSERQVERMRAERSMGWKYLQERKARYVVPEAGDAGVYKREVVAKNMVGALPRREGFRFIVFGVDIARLGNDATAYVGVDDSSGDVVWAERHKKKTGQEIVADLVRLNARFPGCKFRVDSTGHRGYIADFAPSTLNIEETQFSREKEKWVMGLLMLLQMGRLGIPDPEVCGGLAPEFKGALGVLIEELLSFQKIENNQGQVKFSHPDGGTDDVLDGLMLATMDLAKRMQGTLGADGTKRAMDNLGI